jgi:hypothetical protein
MAHVLSGVLHYLVDDWQENFVVVFNRLVGES